jgi:hypothetical protein
MVQYNTNPNLQVPDVYVNLVGPAPVIAPVPSNLIAAIGVAQWGPVNAATPLGIGQLASYFGSQSNRTYDLPTWVNAAAQAGGSIFYCVRVTDNTDTAASFAIASATAVVTAGGTGYVANDFVTFSNGAVVKVLTVTAGAIITFSILTPPSTNGSGALAATSTTGVGTGATLTFTYTTGITITSKYTGSLANTDTVQISAGSQAASLKVSIFRVGQAPEVFDNVGAGLTGLAAWTAIVSALNSGNAAHPSPSQYVVATVGTSTVTPGYQTYTLTGGTDGATGVTATQLTGVDGNSRTGLYALRGIGPAVLMVADAPTTMWAAINAFALSEGHYAIVAGPSGDYAALSIISTFGALGVDSYAVKALVGDYVYWNDSVNNLVRLVSPAPFVAGKLSALNPWQYGLNKPIPGVTGTQSTYANVKYSAAQISAISAARLDVMTLGAPGGNYYALRTGRNSSSNSAINQDNYSRMAPFLQYSMGGALGSFVGRLQTQQEQLDLISALDGFLGGLWAQNAIGTVTPVGQVPVKPYTIQIASTPQQAQAGLQIVNMSVTLLAGVLDLLLNLQTGVTVNQTSGATYTAAQ